ncbi:MAG: N-(5'-phosphoribosyl)anthranilate isomerase [Betaproteobacteria bacterium 13_1_40CM_4_64_4]|nr:MAG: N-(5'-phosphoribosyl)anthranilate isomerase [Betaproteobacteria bacterium 13_1_40CM_4_64_4]
MLTSNATRTRVKICGITRAEDGIAAARAGADAIGLVFWPGTPRRVTLDQARAIVAALPAFVTVVGVNAALAAVPLDLLQFHGDERPELCASFGRPYIKAVPVRPEVDLLQYAARFDAAHGLLFDAYVAGGLPGGTGTSFDWTQLPPQLTDPMSRRLILSGGLTPQNVAAAVRQLHPWAVDVSSGVEVSDADGKPRKGIKSATKIVAFIREVRSADG